MLSLMKIENDEHIKIYVNNHTFLKNIILYNIAPDD